jgi:transposase
MKITRIGIDLAKQVFQLHGVDVNERVVLRRQLKRKEMVDFFKALSPCDIGMEACACAHHWARTLEVMGHRVKLIAPQFVKPYVKGNKNDANDAAAICEAMSRPDMRFVPVKSVEQQNLQALHRIRSELVHQRTAKVNQIRGLLGEYGIVIGQRIQAVRQAIPEILEDAENDLTAHFRKSLRGLQGDLSQLDERVTELDREIEQAAQDNAISRRLQQLRGVGPKVATALLMLLGDGCQFQSGRDASASVGLVPGQHSSGGKDRLLGISKRGNAYVRTLLIHGARAVIQHAKDKTDPLSCWLQSLCQRRGKNIAAVALANKTMRMAWAMLRSGQDYQPDYGRPTEQAQPA